MRSLNQPAPLPVQVWRDMTNRIYEDFRGKVTPFWLATYPNIPDIELVNSVWTTRNQKHLRQS